MSINTDNIKAGDWVQIANGDWYVFINWDGAHAHIGKYTRKGVLGSCGLVLPWLITRHLTAEEVEANGLPVSDRQRLDALDSCQNMKLWARIEELYNGGMPIRPGIDKAIKEGSK